MTQTKIQGKFYLSLVDEQLQNIAQLKFSKFTKREDKPCNDCVSGGEE